MAAPSIKIGLIAPFSGRYRDIGYQAIFGARLALAEHALADPSANYQLELIAFDDKGDIATATKQARKLISDPTVVAVIGHWLDTTTSASATIYSNAKIPMLATASLPRKKIHGDRYIFRLFPTDDILIEQLQNAARYYAAEFTCNCGVIAGAAMLQSVRETTKGTTTVGGPMWSLEEFRGIAGTLAEGTYFITPAPHPLVSPDASHFLDRYHRAYPGQQVGWVSVHAYEATRLLLAALQHSSRSTATHLAKSLVLTNYVDGLLGPVRFTAEGEWQEPRYHVYRWTAGVRSLPNN